MGLHHAKLKAAVGKYSPLHTEGKTSEEVKAEIVKDEKGFNADEVNEIYEAILSQVPDSPKLVNHTVTQEDLDNNPELVEKGIQVDDIIQIEGKPDQSVGTTQTAKAEKSKKPKYIVTKPFRDKDNWDKVFQIGEDVSHFSEERINHLLTIEHIQAK